MAVGASIAAAKGKTKVQMLEEALKASNAGEPITFDLKGTAIGIAGAIAADPRVQTKAAEAVSFVKEYAGKKAEGIAKGLFHQVDVLTTPGSNTKDIRVASTAAHRMMSGSSATEKPLGFMAFTISRKQSPYIKKVKTMFATATKFYTYQSQVANTRWYTTGLNAKGVYWGGNNIGGNKMISAPVTGTATNIFQLNLDAITTLGLPALQLKQDAFCALNFTTWDDMVALYQTIPSGSDPIVQTTLNQTDLRFPMELRMLEFELTNLNKYLNGHFEIYRLVAKTNIFGGGSGPEERWYDGSAGAGLGVAGSYVNDGYLGFFKRNDALPTGTSNNYNAGIDFNLKSTPGLSSLFKEFWDIDEVRKVILKPDQTMKVVVRETLSNGISLDEISRRLVDNVAIPAGGVYFMIVARTAPLYVERAASSVEPINPAYNILAESGFLNYKVSNIKKSYSAHVPRRGDANNPWKNCLGISQTTSIILPTYEYADGSYLDSTGALSGGKYSMPLVTPNAVQYGGKLD